MIIYKITNKINNKIYIGQTTQSLKKRWYQHKKHMKLNKNKPLYNAMKKYGIDNFKIEEIGGANSITELNYQEWLLIHKHDTLWPNGYNLKEGGGHKGKHSVFSRNKLSKSLKTFYKKNQSKKCKKVVNIKTKKIYESLKICCLENSVNYSTMRSKLQGINGNDTDFRYLNCEKTKKPCKKKKILDISNGYIFQSIAECAKCNNINYGTLKAKLSGKIKNNTNFRYLEE